MATTYKIQTQLITVHDPTMRKRIRDARKTRWTTWNKYRERLSNIESAIVYVTRAMLNRHIGGIVIVRTVINGYSTPSFVKVFQAKWGNDNIPFVRFDGVVGEYWRRQIQQSNPELTNQLTLIAKRHEQSKLKRELQKAFK